jgi:hypothetical protein
VPAALSERLQPTGGVRRQTSLLALRRSRRHSALRKKSGRALARRKSSQGPSEGKITVIVLYFKSELINPCNCIAVSLLGVIILLALNGVFNVYFHRPFFCVKRRIVRFKSSTWLSLKISPNLAMVACKFTLVNESSHLRWLWYLFSLENHFRGLLNVSRIEHLVFVIQIELYVQLQIPKNQLHVIEIHCHSNFVSNYL